MKIRQQKIRRNYLPVLKFDFLNSKNAEKKLASNKYDLVLVLSTNAVSFHNSQVLPIPDLKYVADEQQMRSCIMKIMRLTENLKYMSRIAIYSDNGTNRTSAAAMIIMHEFKQSLEDIGRHISSLAPNAVPNRAMLMTYDEMRKSYLFSACAYFASYPKPHWMR